VRFKDMTEAESAPILRYPSNTRPAPSLPAGFRWEVGSIAFWTTAARWHNAVNDFHGFRRVMQRNHAGR